MFPVDKFTLPFIRFIDRNFIINEHLFIINSIINVEFLNNINVVIVEKDNFRKKNYFNYSKKIREYCKNANKIIYHSLHGDNKFLFLFFNQYLLKKTFWVIWGADLYDYQKMDNSISDKIKFYIKKQVIKKMGHFITYIKGDYELAQKWYGANGKYHECFMYPSNLYKEYDVKEKSSGTINIQVGNSADPSNNHLEVLDKLTKYKNENIKIFVPLSYGDEKYASEIIAKGKEIFGDSFIALTEFMPFDKYLDFLGDIDIAIFAHKRQQAMGNTITLLGLGKKVYMRNDVTPWKLFNDIDIKVFDVENIDIDVIMEETKVDNKRKIKEYFSEENYLKQLQNLFESK